jgi:predicted DNA repair protein MutK
VSVGLLALLDDVAAIAKVAAASLDDIAGQAARAGVKAAGAVIDDAAVTPRYVHGFSADRELPIVGKIALGSIRNKLVFLLPAALLLSAFLPWLISPLLMIGGAYLCYEGAEKVFAALFPHQAHGHEAHVEPTSDPADATMLEEEKVSGAIKTDFILSAEIMTIALAALPAQNVVMQAAVLALVGIGITVLVYGGVALIVKADDFGLVLASRGRTHTGRAIGRGLVSGMPTFMRVLGIVGTAAMIWVGGGIVIHGLATFGFTAVEHAAEAVAEAAAHAVPGVAGVIHWAVVAAISGVFGLIVGALLIPVAEHVIVPLFNVIRPKGKRPPSASA